MDTMLVLSLCEGSQYGSIRAAEVCQVVLDAGAPPDWIMLVPAGDHVRAHDGREFSNSDPQAVVDRFEADPRDLPIDWDHANEIKAPAGEQAPAAGWIVAMEVRAGAIWGRVEWTPKGAESLRTREYRYISPAFIHRTKDKKVVELVSAGLTNRPALDLPALARNAEKPGGEWPPNTQEVSLMNPKLLALLGLQPNATDEQVLASVRELQHKAETFRLQNERVQKDRDEYKELLSVAQSELKQASEPSLDKFVPRADHDAVVARAESAEKKLADMDQSSKQEKIDSAIKSALEAGKITPATVEYHKAQCAQEGGLKRFEEFLAAAPVVVGGKTDTDKKIEGTKKELTAEQRKVAERGGLTGKALEIFENSIQASVQ